MWSTVYFGVEKFEVDMSSNGSECTATRMLFGEMPGQPSM